MIASAIDCETDKEIENLKALAKKAVKPEDRLLVEVITEYLEGFCKIKQDCIGVVVTAGFIEIKKVIRDNEAIRIKNTNDINQGLNDIKKELHMNGWAKKG